MDFDSIISKIAADKDNKQLGKVSRIENLMGKTVKVSKQYALILTRRRFRTNVIVPLETDKVTKIEGQYVWFDILKEDFEKQTKREADIKVEREIYTGMLPQQESRNRYYGGLDVTGLATKKKERKR